jgi:outer membrane receptor protein involved in Fe transport
MVEDASISNFGDQGCNCPLLESEQVFQLVNNWTKIWRNHSFRFGGDIRYAMNLRDASDSNRAGQLSFGNGATGSGIASVLLGYVDTFQRFDVYSPNAANRQKRGAFYAQDTWRLRRTSR